MKSQEQIKLEWREGIGRLKEAVEEISCWTRPDRWSNPIWDGDFLIVQQELLNLLQLRRDLYILSEMEEHRRAREQQLSAEGGGST